MSDELMAPTSFRKQGATTASGLRDLLVAGQHRRCAYGTTEGDGQMCDCKYHNPFGFNGSEATHAADRRK